MIERTGGSTGSASDPNLRMPASSKSVDGRKASLPHNHRVGPHCCTKGTGGRSTDCSSCHRPTPSRTAAALSILAVSGVLVTVESRPRC
ncbi:hypothetical protein Cni_G27755 [Canna indica]|uniref:Uncharacterized protein n=1 Tax=Canna indica TaxID=4628 RepID=A0AAQ3QRM4_9LILI|nr:hypothetical protein Cni_G27755 [Canna indica]